MIPPPMTATATGFWPRLIALTHKEFRQMFRDRSVLAFGIGLPLILILLFGYGVSLDVKDAPVAIVLEDRSAQAMETISGLQLSPYIAPVLVTSMHEAESLMRAGQVDGILRLRHDFSSQLSAGSAQVQLLVHGRDANRARTIMNYVQGALAQSALRQADRSGQGTAQRQVVLEPQMWFNSANTSTWFLVPGLIMLIMSLVGTLLTAPVMAREWERGTLEALFVTRVRPTEILLGKLVPYFCLGMAGFSMCLLASRFLFKVPMQGSLAILLVVSMTYLLVALCQGLVISSMSKNQFLAGQFALLVSFMPAQMLSGFMFDLTCVPPAVRWVGNFLPATYYVELLRTLFLAGNVWPLILRDTAVLLLFAVALIVMARAVTCKKLG